MRIFLLVLMAGLWPMVVWSAECGSQTGFVSSSQNSADSECSEGAADPGSSIPGQIPSTSVGNPIDFTTGNKYQQESDFQIDGLMLQFRRHYNSNNGDFNQGLGFGWHHSYRVELERTLEGELIVVQSNGRRVSFSPSDHEHVWRGVLPQDGLIRRVDQHYFWHLSDGRRLQFRGPLLVSIRFPDGEVLTLKYRSGQLSTVSDRAGRVLTFRYYGDKRRALSDYAEAAENFPEQSHVDGMLAAVELPNGDELRYRYDDRLNLQSVEFKDGTLRVYHYEDMHFPHKLTGISNRLGVRYVWWQYDVDGRAVLSKQAKPGQQVDIEYDDTETDVRTASVTDSTGKVSRYHWRILSDGQARLSASDGAGCSSCPPTGWQYRYTTTGQVSESVSPQGIRFFYTYDDFHRLVRIEQAYPGSNPELIRRMTYRGTEIQPHSISVPSVRPGELHTTTINRDSDGFVTSWVESGFAPVYSLDEEQPDWKTIQRAFTYTRNDGWLVSADGPLEGTADTTLYRREGAGRLVGIERPDGSSVVLARFNAFGQPQFLQRNEQTPLQLSYDSEGRILALETLAGRYSYAYDAEGQLLSRTTPDDRTIHYRYHDSGALAELVDDIQRTLKLDYTSENLLETLRLSTADGQLIRSLSVSYDYRNRPRRVRKSHVRANSKQASITTYNLAYHPDTGLLESVTGGNQQVLEYQYHPSGLLSSVVDAYRVRSDFPHGEKGQLGSERDSRGNLNRVVKDDFGRVVMTESPDTGRQLFDYDAASRLVARIDGGGVRTTFERSAAGRLLRMKSTDTDTTLTWHANNGRIASIANRVTIERFDYDNEARLTEHRRDIDQHTFVTTYAYDQRGRQATKRLPDGQTLRFDYHQGGTNRGQLQAIQVDRLMGVAQDTVIGNLDSDRRDGRTEFTVTGGVRNTRDFTMDGDVTRIVAQGFSHLDYEYGNDGRIAEMAENGRRQTYTYQSSRLSTADLIQGRFSFSHDRVGNRLSDRVEPSTSPSRARQFAVSPPGRGNRLLTDGAGQALRYNQQGSLLVTSGDLTFDYDSQQRLVKVAKSGQPIAEYAYNGFGERVKKRVLADGEWRTEYYTYDLARMSGIYSSDGSLSQHYVFAGDLPVAVLMPGQILAVHADHLGTPRLLTNSRKEIVWAALVDPFGRATPTVETVTFNLRFAGQYLDHETGLHYNYMRYYDPDTGRYLTTDPLDTLPGPNRYLYVNADPIHFVDPLGLYLVAFDGTWNDPPSNTNVRHIYNHYNSGARSYYVGVGTGGGADKYIGGGFGYGARSRVNQAIDDLIAHLKTDPTDNQIDIVGFSRGSAQAREFANRILDMKASGEIEQEFTIRFLGLFDTVPTGLPIDGFAEQGPPPCGEYDLTISPDVQYTAQATALNEHRRLFPLYTIEPDHTQPGSDPSIVEAAFLGAHSDIGGGYYNAPQGALTPATTKGSGDLSDVTLQWMLMQAEKAGVAFSAVPQELRRVESPVLHDERWQVPGFWNSDRRVHHINDTRYQDFWVDPPWLVDTELGQRYWPAAKRPKIPRRGWEIDRQRDHPLHETLKQFINEDGTVDMAKYSEWLRLNYGLEIYY